jgi:hypothetical protein
MDVIFTFFMFHLPFFLKFLTLSIFASFLYHRTQTIEKGMENNAGDNPNRFENSDKFEKFILGKLI